MEPKRSLAPFWFEKGDYILGRLQIFFIAKAYLTQLKVGLFFLG